MRQWAGSCWCGGGDGGGGGEGGGGEGGDNHVSVRATVHEGEDFIDIIINMHTMEISCEKNGIEMPEENISAGLDMFHNLYMDICIVTDTLYEDSI